MKSKAVKWLLIFSYSLLFYKKQFIAYVSFPPLLKKVMWLSVAVHAFNVQFGKHFIW